MMDFLEKDTAKLINMNKKASKKLRRLAAAIAVNNNQTPEQARVIYKRLKAVHKSNPK